MMRKRLISTLLALCMVLSLLPPVTVTASAAFEGAASGGGTEDNPYKISTPEQLKAFRDYINSNSSGGEGEYFLLMADIDLNGDKDNQWAPIGTSYSKPFNGIFDGADHIISGLYINLSYGGYQGLFGCVGNDGIVKNLGVDGSISIAGSASSLRIGGVVGRNYGGTVKNCYNKSSIVGTGDAEYVGGVVGDNSGTVENCYNSGSVEGKYGGGVVGHNIGGTVKNCHNTGNVGAEGNYYVGGVVGLNGTAIALEGGYVGKGTVENCYNTGSVVGDYNVGGVVGCNNNSATVVESCYNIGNITGTSTIGGVVGNNYGGTEKCYNTGSVVGDHYVGGVVGANMGARSVAEDNYGGTVNNCCNTSSGTVSGDKEVGGVVGYNLSGTVKNCYNTSICIVSSNKVGGVVGYNDDSVENCYYLGGVANGGINGSDVAGQAESKTEEEFASGEVRDLLQGTQDPQVWYQTIGTDAYPRLAFEIRKNNVFFWNTPFNGDREPDWEYTYFYDESWFFQSSYSYQHDLTKMSMCIAMAAYGAYDEASNNTYTEKNIKALFSDLGFDNKSTYYYNKPQYDSIGYAIGSKNIISDSGENCSLVLVAVRGGGYGVEWGGNFRITGDDGQLAHDKTHMGFSLARDQVIEGIERYFKEYATELSSNCKIWIVGYSRAAATTNLVAKKLDDRAVDLNGISIKPKNIYAFCFECPQNTTDEDGVSKKKYNNIINIANPVDFVTKVAMSKWGFSRYGRTLFLPYAEGYNGSYSEMLKAMYASYYSIARYNGYDDLLVHEVIPMNGQTSILDRFMENLAWLLVNPFYYYKSLNQAVFIGIAADTLGGEGVDGALLAEILFGISDLGKLLIYRPINSSLVGGLLASGCFQSGHYPELCLAWLNSLDGDISSFADPTYRKVFINCPVDVSVYSNSGQLVAQINNDIVQEIDNGLVVYIDDCEQKVISLPNNEEYTIQLTATDNGTVTYTATEYNIDSSKTEKVVSYYEVDVATGDELIGLAENLDNVDSAVYPLYLNNKENALIPTITQEDADVMEYVVNIEVSGNGKAYGAGTYVNGEFVKVIADADQNSSFIGWYEDERLLSTDCEYRFLVKDDSYIIAKFDDDSDSHIITFDPNGGITEIETLMTDANGKLAQIPVATYDGYVFDGWYTAPSGGEQIDTDTVFDENTTIYAHWTPVQIDEEQSYTITFDANGGNISPMTAVTGSDGKLSDIPVPTRSGYTFEGWYTELSGGTRITENTTFTQDTIVYAHWTYKGNDSNLSGSGESSSHSRRHKASVSTDHSIIISDTIGGMVRSNRSSVAEGDKVTLTILVDDGYELDNLSVETVSGSTIRTTQISGERYTFIMPDEEVTVYAVFKPTNEIGQLPEIPFNFTDVPQNEYYYDAVRWAVEQGITSGTTLTMFSPDKSCTRAEAVTFLWRANGCPSPLGNVNPFTDVARDEYYYNAVLWAVENGIASGTSATTFSPNAVVTRGQTVSFLYRAAGSPAVGGGLPFLDVASDAYYANAVQWAVSEGITSGTSAMAFSPDADCTRAQIVVFLYRAQS